MIAMTDLQENLGWIIGSIATVIAMAIGWFLSSGVVVNLLFLLIGSGITYFVQTRTQRRAWRRENALTMRDEVYGPLYREISKILENLESIKRPDWEIGQNLKEEMDHYLFYKISPALKTRLNILLDRFEKYNALYLATENKVIDAIRNKVQKAFNVDIQRRSGAVSLTLEIEDVILDSIVLEQALIREVNPTVFVDECKSGWGEDISIKVYMGGTKKNFDDFQSLYESVLKQVEKETVYKQEKIHRRILIAELGRFLKKIVVFLDID